MVVQGGIDDTGCESFVERAGRCHSGSMPMTLVKGHYRIVGASPDGDSVRFYPLDPGVWEAAGIAGRTNSPGGAHLRLDAIDALETHYAPPHAGSPWRQPAALGDGAAAAL